MAMQNNTQRTTDALTKARNDIANATGWLDRELQKHEARNASWGTVNSLEHVRENLAETLAILTGIEQAEITRRLDKMNAPAAREKESTAQETILNIAKRDLGLATLEEQKRDSLDFHELAVWEIKAALEAAYQAGRASK